MHREGGGGGRLSTKNVMSPLSPIYIYTHHRISPAGDVPWNNKDKNAKRKELDDRLRE